MFLRASLLSSFAKIKPLKLQGNAEGNGVLFTSGTSSHSFQVDNPLETLIGSLAACELATLKAVSKNSNLKIKNVKFSKIESGLDIEKFMKGGPEDKIEDVLVEAEVETNVTQEELNQWLIKA